MILEAANLMPEDIRKIVSVSGEYKKFTFDEYIELGNGTYMRKLLAYKQLINYLNTYFEMHGEDEIGEIEHMINEYFIIQQTDKNHAKVHLESYLKRKYIIDYNAKLIYEELFRLYSKVAESMPQWLKKGEDGAERKEQNTKAEKIGRNDLCYCGSGKKYKKCHGR